MALVEINWNPSRRDLRQFAAIWLPALCALIGFWIWRGTGSATAAVAALAIGVLLGVIGFAAPAVIRPVFLGLTCAAFPIGWVVSHVILAITYYAIITPIGLVMRLCGSDSMQRKIDRAAESYWIARENTADKRRYFRQF